MRELRTPGSVRGVLGNGHPYRDRAPPAHLRRSQPACFDTLPRDLKLSRAAADRGYMSMKPIQAKAVPIVLSSRCHGRCAE